MGSESASYELALTASAAAALAGRLQDAGVECRARDERRVDLVVRDPHRYWIDLRVHRASPPRLEIRIALTNDTWSIRAPLQRALTPLPPELEGVAMCDDAGIVLATVGEDGWLLALQDDYERRRDVFIARVGDYSGPLSADHV